MSFLTTLSHVVTDETETWVREEIPFALRIVPRGLSLLTAHHNVTSSYSDQANHLMEIQRYR